MRILLFTVCTLLTLAQNIFASERCKTVSQLMEFRQLIDQGDFKTCASTCVINAAQIIHKEIKGTPIEFDLRDFMWDQIRAADKRGIHIGTGAYQDDLHRFAKQIFKVLQLEVKLTTYHSSELPERNPRGSFRVERLDLKHLQFDENKKEALFISAAVEGGAHLLLVVSAEPLPDLIHFTNHEKRIRINFIDPNAPDYLATGFFLQDVDSISGVTTSVRLFIPANSDLRVRVPYYEIMEDFAIMSATVVRPQ